MIEFEALFTCTWVRGVSRWTIAKQQSKLVGAILFCAGNVRIAFLPCAQTCCFPVFSATISGRVTKKHLDTCLFFFTTQSTIITSRQYPARTFRVKASRCRTSSRPHSCLSICLARPGRLVRPWTSWNSQARVRQRLAMSQSRTRSSPS